MIHIYTVCNMCGETFDTYDDQNGFGFHHQARYGSKFDGEQFDADFCCECHDKIIELINKRCKFNIIRSDDGGCGALIPEVSPA